MDKNRKKILMELRPAADGFAGIPQETRLLFAMFSGSEKVELTGLLNNHQRMLTAPKKQNGSGDFAQGDRIFEMSTAVLALNGVHAGTLSEIFKFSDRARHLSNMLMQVAWLKLITFINSDIKIFDLKLDAFRDFVWDTFMSKSIPVSEFDRVLSQRFASMSPGWHALQRAGTPLFGRSEYPRMDTSGYDFFMSQTPWPARVRRNTQLLVRYHDAVPLYYPHTIHNPHWHKSAHYNALVSNLKQGGICICNSENSRSEFLGLFPEREQQACVIPCVVSDVYAGKGGEREDAEIGEIIRSGLEPKTQPSFSTGQNRENFYQMHLGKKDFRYLLVVSTIEPRKNHSRLISAWRMIANATAPDLKLVVVGRPGWRCEATLEQMRGFQERGLLFNISHVSAANLRTLYANAAAVICPSIAEGFDLSGIEAMLSGGVVAASDIPVHREIYQNGCVYFDPYSTRAAADVIAGLIHKDAEGQRKALRRAGSKLGRAFLRESIQPRWEDLLENLYREKSSNNIYNTKRK